MAAQNGRSVHFPSQSGFFSRWPATFFFFFNSEIDPFQQCFSCFFLYNKKSKKKIGGGPKKEAGGDAKHVYLFTWP